MEGYVQKEDVRRIAVRLLKSFRDRVLFINALDELPIEPVNVMIDADYINNRVTVTKAHYLELLNAYRNESLFLMHTCDNCGLKSNCAHVPYTGQLTRSNCFSWVPVYEK